MHPLKIVNVFKGSNTTTLLYQLNTNYIYICAVGIASFISVRRAKAVRYSLKFFVSNLKFVILIHGLLSLSISTLDVFRREESGEGNALIIDAMNEGAVIE